MIKIKYLRKSLIALMIGSSLALGACIQPFMTHQSVSAHRVAAYDISQWQGHLNKHQIKRLKHEVHFMILRGEYGSSYKDAQFSHTANMLNHYHIPYGVYDYSIYHNPSQARKEAQSLYNRAPYANFYVNDAEENDAGSEFNKSTQAWSHEIKHLTNKPTVLYSGLAFMNEHMTRHTRHTYNANWLAAYSSYQPHPTYHYALWQYTSNHHSNALRQNVDADIIPKGSNKPMSFWTGKGHNHSTITRKAPQMKNENISTVSVQYHAVK